ncbi:MAG: hypothetical protein IPL34_20375 [Thiofilum sp.]|uniref:hypothetical protein n=1 Tax=Thiofilum sp. TaxID=2212733 RepID=UPI0025E82B9D|nr:hypothetical protein [Thiofilum sp.]MBK8455639.1 hypothetical protein [Thiofilum sp.]
MDEQEINDQIITELTEKFKGVDQHEFIHMFASAQIAALLCILRSKDITTQKEFNKYLDAVLSRLAKECNKEETKE